MDICENVLEAVGHTPLVHLGKIERDLGLEARILAKLERSNPTGSIKDRAAKAIVEKALARGQIAPGGTLVEPTSGNTGIGLAAICTSLGINLIIYIPENCSRERVLMMRALGAKVILTPTKEGMTGAVAAADAYLAAHPEAHLAGQFENEANPQAHYETTGPEIWAQTEGRVDCFVASFGTGGTLSGVSRFLKEKDRSILTVGLEPASSPFVSQGQKGPHLIQGIGAGFKPGCLHLETVDEVLTITDEQAYEYTRMLANREGLFVGISSGCNLAGAIILARRPEMAGKTIVTVLPDDGERYLSVEGLYD